MRDIFPNRIKVLQFFIMFWFIIFTLRLFHLQIIDKNSLKRSQSNAIKELIDYPQRGQIFDRNNILVVNNQSLYDIIVTPSEIDKNIDSFLLCQVLNIPIEYYSEIIKKANNISKYKPFIFLKQVSFENYQLFQESSFKFKGFYAQTRSIRQYPFNCGALIFGDIGEVDSSQILAYQDYAYLSGDYIGKNGIENYYEPYLRGERGIKVIMVDALNRVKGTYADGKYDKEPKAGFDLESSLDINLQIFGEELMRNKSGAIVAIEPATGEILAMVSSPTFDPNLLSGKSRNKYYPILLRNKAKPLYNRAIQGLYPPGSTFKSIIALIALQMNAIDTNFTYYCPGYYPIGAKRLKCSHRHAPCRNIKEALTQSCNPYFCQTFRNSIEIDNSRYSAQLDYQIWYENMMKFGVNKKLDLDLKNEKKGNLPDTTFYNKIYKNQWKPTTVISLGIGQGEVLMTPLQMASSYCVIANRGYHYTPHLIRKILISDDKFELPQIKKQVINIQKAYFESVIDGLEKVVQVGTGRSAKIADISVCGKTGTSQNPHGQDHSVFVGFAPKHDPKIVVACIVENAGSGGSTAAPIVSLMIEKFIKKEIPTSRMGLVNSIKNRVITKFKIDETDSTTKKQN
ncbi:MAG: penicillin-binding protein 2 [Chitinophagales bacterium]|jgi:penicillin-binding protein 2|nr:penicillin-binding protein 2 [Chitinophagales bacterium]